MSVSIDTSKFPLIMFSLGPEQINDIEVVSTNLEKVFELAKTKKMKVSVVIEAGESEGFGIIATVQIVKYLIDSKPKIKKYFNRCCITMEDNEGMFSYILSIYTPARPLKLFKTVQMSQALHWVTTVDG